MRAHGPVPEGGLAITGVRADAAGRAGRRADVRAAGRAGRARRGGASRSPTRKRAPRTPAVTTPRWPASWARPWACSTPRPSTTSPAAWPSSRVPAEEYGDVAWRVAQRNEGKLEFLGGKPEMLRLGHLDDVDMAMMIHATPAPRGGQAGGARVQQRLRGEDGALRRQAPPTRAARRTSGINALYAANIGLVAINAHPRDVPRRGHDPRAPDHHPRRLAGERDPGRSAARDVRARQVARGHRGRGPEGGPRAPGRRAGPRLPRSRSRPCPVTCRCAATP